jgi:hypothetical protein
MDDLIGLIRSYQAIDPATGLATEDRSTRDYAQLLGVTHPTLYRFYLGQIERPWAIVIGFLSLFPAACPETCAILAGLRADRAA